MTEEQKPKGRVYDVTSHVDQNQRAETQKAKGTVVDVTSSTQQGQTAPPGKSDCDDDGS